MRLRELI